MWTCPYPDCPKTQMNSLELAGDIVDQWTGHRPNPTEADDPLR